MSCILGLNGALICNVNDDPSLVRASSTSSLSFNRTNLPTFETPRRVERLVPPMGFWNTYGVSTFSSLFDFHRNHLFVIQFKTQNVGNKNYLH